MIKWNGNIETMKKTRTNASIAQFKWQVENGFSCFDSLCTTLKMFFNVKEYPTDILIWMWLE